MRRMAMMRVGHSEWELMEWSVAMMRVVGS